MIVNFKNMISNLVKIIKEDRYKDTYIASYRLIEIREKEKGEYIATIQILNKNSIFYAKPEDILKEDTIVDKFSPRDIRTLTYLGYLAFNCPKYSVLAKKLVEDTDKTIFALKEKGNKKIITKSAEEILFDEKILNNLSMNDATDIAYTAAHEAIQIESMQKETLIKQLKHKLKQV